MTPGDRSPESPLTGQEESVDRWPLAITTRKLFGELPKVVAASRGVTANRESPLEGSMPQSAGGPRGPGVASAADHPLGNPVGAIG